MLQPPVVGTQKRKELAMTTLPKQKDLELPLLWMAESGVSHDEAFAVLVEGFGLSDQTVDRRYDTMPNVKKFGHRVRWAKATLKIKGLIDVQGAHVGRPRNTETDRITLTEKGKLVLYGARLAA
jgi:hypothetical protein